MSPPPSIPALTEMILMSPPQSTPVLTETRQSRPVNILISPLTTAAALMELITNTAAMEHPDLVEQTSTMKMNQVEHQNIVLSQF